MLLVLRQLGRDFNGRKLTPIKDSLFLDRKIKNVKNHLGDGGRGFLSCYSLKKPCNFLEGIFECANLQYCDILGDDCWVLQEFS